MSKRILQISLVIMFLTACAPATEITPTSTATAAPPVTPTITPVPTRTQVPTETPVPTPEYPTSCFDVVDEVAANFSSLDRGPNGDGVGAGRTVEELSTFVKDPVTGRIESPSFYPLGFEQKPDMPARLQGDGAIVGNARMSLENGEIGICSIVVDKDGNKYPLLIGSDHNGKFVLATDIMLWHSESNHGEYIESMPRTIEAMERFLNDRIGMLVHLDIVLHWRSTDKIGAELPNKDGVGMLGSDPYFYEMTVARENGTYKMGLELTELLKLYLDNDRALLSRRLMFYIP